MLKIWLMLMLNTWMMLLVIIMQLLMGKWMTCDKLSSGNGGCLIVNQAHTNTIYDGFNQMHQRLKQCCHITLETAAL